MFESELTLFNLITIGEIIIFIFFFINILHINYKFNKYKKLIDNENLKYNFNSNKVIKVNYNNKFSICMVIFFIIMVCLSIYVRVYNNSYIQIELFAFIAFISCFNLAPHYIEIKNNNVYYKNLCNTLNRTLVIPIGKIERIVEDSKYSKTSFIINKEVIFEIKNFLIPNYNDVCNFFNKYIREREDICNLDVDNINSKIYIGNKIEVRRNIGDYILLFIIFFMCFLLGFWNILYNFDFYNVFIFLFLSFWILSIYPYKIILYNDRIEYKHILFTRNKFRSIYINSIKNINFKDFEYTGNYYKQTRKSNFLNIDFISNGKICCDNIPISYQNEDDINQIIKIMLSINPNICYKKE